MNTQIVFSLSDLGWLVIWGLVVVILVYLILILFRFYRSFKKIMAIVDDNRVNINKVLDEAPGITQNVNEISEEVSHAMQAFRGTVDNIATTTGAATGKIVENNDVVSQITLFFKVVATIKDGLDKVLGRSHQEPVFTGVKANPSQESTTDSQASDGTM